MSRILTRKRIAIFLTPVLLLTLLVGGWFVHYLIEQNNNYKLIREVVAQQPFAVDTTEVRRMNAQDCYPKSGERRVCQAIEYQLSQDRCSGVEGAEDRKKLGCTSMEYERTYKGATIRFSVDRDGAEHGAYVLMIGKE